MGKWKAGELRSTFIHMINTLGDDGLTAKRLATWGGVGLGGLALAVNALDAALGSPSASGAVLGLGKIIEATAIATATGAGMGAATVVGAAMGMTLGEMNLKRWRESKAPRAKPAAANKGPNPE